MKKLIITLLLSFTTLMAVSNKDDTFSKIMDRVYLDVNLGEEVSYQYVPFSNNFNLKTEKLNKVFNLYRTKGLDEGSFTISGKFELPLDVGNKVAILIRGVKTTSNTLYNLNTGNIGVYTYINDEKLTR